MNNKIDYSGLIDRYLSRQMKQEELAWFEEEMDVNPDLAEEVQMQKAIGSAILNEETLEFRALIGNLFEREENKKPAKSRKKFTLRPAMRVAVASFAALIILGTGLFMHQHRSIPADKLFDIYYEPYDGLMNARSSSLQMTDILITAMQKYEARDFEAALMLFQTVLANDAENITSRFYSGISYMEIDRYNVAGRSFSEIINHNDNLFIEHAEWYLGLCYMMTGEDDLARKVFTSIAGSNGYYSKKANRLLRNM